ncbi:unnamed protein product [Prorocentrum cordatum]|uniref:Uncharacterized protein n=1 Tax=Prorocentrum cordatum TaxID=2364126 RepID=A0ABN9PDK8_9DINO|nr:unnamed protein product [Polarella glacialis]
MAVAAGSVALTEMRTCDTAAYAACSSPWKEEGGSEYMVLVEVFGAHVCCLGGPAKQLCHAPSCLRARQRTTYVKTAVWRPRAPAVAEWKEGGDVMRMGMGKKSRIAYLASIAVPLGAQSVSCSTTS